MVKSALELLDEIKPKSKKSALDLLDEIDVVAPPAPKQPSLIEKAGSLLRKTAEMRAKIGESEIVRASGRTTGRNIEQTLKSPEFQTSLSELRRPGYYPELGVEAVRGAGRTVASLPQALGSGLMELGETAGVPPSPTEEILKLINPLLKPYYEAKQFKNKLLTMTGLDKKAVKLGKSWIERNQAWVEDLKLEPNQEDALKGFVFDLGSGATTMGAALGLSYLTKSPNAAAIMFGLYQKANLYQEAREAGVSVTRASQLSTIGGVVEGSLEYIGLDRWLKANGAWTRKLVIRMATEFSQEFSQEVGENMVAKLGWQGRQSFFQGTLRAGIIGAMLSAPASVTTDYFTKKGLIKDFTKAGIPEKQAKGFAQKVIGKVQSEVQNKVEQEIHPKSAEELFKEIPETKKVSAKDEFKVGDILNPQGNTNMVGNVTIREVKGNTLKFTDSSGTDFAGMARSQVRELVKAGAWKRVTVKKTSEQLFDEIETEKPQALKIKAQTKAQSKAYEALRKAQEGINTASTNEQLVKSKADFDKAMVQMIEANEQAKEPQVKGLGFAKKLKKSIEKYNKRAEEGTGEEIETKKPQGLSAKQQAVVMPKEALVSDRINKTQIISNLSKIWGVAIRGKATHGFGARKVGHFEVKPEVIRTKVWGDLEPMAHEIAHHLDKKYAHVLWKRIVRDGKTIKRLDLPKDMISEVAGLDYNPKLRRTSEGFAEFIRMYLTTPEIALEKAPKFSQYFTSKFLPAHPEINTRLVRTKNLFKIWQRQGAEARVASQIDFKGEHEEVKTAKEKAEKAWRVTSKYFRDEFYDLQKVTEAIEKETGKKLPPAHNPFELATLSKSKAGAIARTFVMQKTIDEQANITGPGLMEVLKPVPRRDMKDFTLYATMLRAKNLEARGIESGFDKADINYILEKFNNPVWNKVAKDVTNWSNRLMDWVIRAGGLSKEAAQVMRDLNPIYVPFKRIFIDKMQVQKGGGGLTVKGQPFKRIKGSGRPVINPIESLISSATQIISKAQKLRIVSALADVADEEGVGGFIVEVPKPTGVSMASIRKLKAILQAKERRKVVGAETQEDFDALIKRAGIDLGALDLDDVLTVFSQENFYRGKDNIIPIWRKGELKFYELHPELYEALEGVDPLKLGPVLKILAPASRLLRLGATGLRAAFGLIRNPFRDIFTRTATTKTGRTGPQIFAGSYVGMAKDVFAKEGGLAWRFKAGGGALSSMMGFDRAAAMKVYDEMMIEKLGKVGKVLKVVKNPVNFMRGVFSVSELGPRIDEFEGMMAKNAREHPEWSAEDVYVRSFNDAQDVTVNFSRSGRIGKQWNQATAFFNANIQGPDKLARTFQHHPVRTFIRGLSYVTLLGLTTWFINKDKEWYKNLPPEYKYSNFFFQINKDVIVRLPIPFELGVIFYSIPMALVDYAYISGDRRFKATLNILKSQIPSLIPTLFEPALNVARNKNFLDIPIESKADKNLPTKERVRHYTRRTAKAFSAALNKLGLNLSPVQVDYLINQHTGGALRQIPGDIKTLADIPVVGDVILRNPYYPRRQLNEFFEEWTDLAQKKAAGLETTTENNRYNRLKPRRKQITEIMKKLRDLNQRKGESVKALIEAHNKKLTIILKATGIR